MARECPTKKKSQSTSKPTFRSSKPYTRRKPPSGQYKRPFRSNPLGYQPQVRTASIEEVTEEEGESYDEEECEVQDSEIPSLVARTAKLSEGQRAEWLGEMKDKFGVNF